jgi:hypothetical protein
MDELIVAIELIDSSGQVVHQITLKEIQEYLLSKME